MAGTSHILADDFVALFFAVNVFVFNDVEVLALFADNDVEVSLGELVDDGLVLTGSNLFVLISSDSALCSVEFLKAIGRDHTDLVIERSFRFPCAHLGGSCDASALVDGEDVGGTASLRRGSSLATTGLLEALKGTVVKATLRLLLSLLFNFAAGILVEAITDALAESIHTSMAACSVGLLVAHALVVSIRVEGTSARCQLDGLALGRHLSLRSASSALANVG